MKFFMTCKVDFNVLSKDQNANTGWEGKLAHDARILLLFWKLVIP